MASVMDTAIPEHVDPARVADVDVYAIEGLGEGYHEAWSRIMAANPEIVWTPRNEGHWIALGGEALAEVQSDWTRFSSRVIVLPKSMGEHHQLLPTTIDPPEHRPYRKLLNENMTPSAIRGLKDSIRTASVHLIEKVRPLGHCNFTESYAQVFPLHIFLAMLGVPLTDADHIRHLALCMTNQGMDLDFEEARTQFYAYADPLIRDRMANPREDMLSRLLTAGVEEEGVRREIRHDEALALVVQVLIAGVDTVGNFLGFAMKALAESPELKAQVLAHPGGSLAAANELFRRFGLVSIAREVRHDMEFRGVAMKAGDMVSIPTAIHGIDPKLNDDPLTIDLSRRRPVHSTFGSGAHMCPGQELARAEAAITIEEWLKRVPDFRIAPDSDLTNETGIVASVRRVCLEWDV